jgi:exopolysaccharide biosynthesis polyprenyl glycosylphosphotransferase
MTTAGSAFPRHRVALNAVSRSQRRKAPSLSVAPHIGTAWTSRYRLRLAATDTVIVAGTSTVALSVSDPHALPFGLCLILLWSLALESYRSRATYVIGVGSGEYKRVVAASTFTFGALAIFSLLLDTHELRMLFVIALPAGTGTLVFCRWLWRQWLITQRRRGQYLARAILVGRANDVIDITARMDKRPGSAYTVVGAVLDGYEERSIDVGPRSLPVLTNPDSIASAVRAMRADTVIVVGQHSGDQKFIKHLSWSLEETSVDFVLAVALTDVASPRMHMHPVEGLPLMHVKLPTFEGGKHVVKRSFDVVLSGLALIALAPFIGIIALIVRTGTPGPAFFRQERVGKDGRTFTMIKFRSMVETAEQDRAALEQHNEGAGVLFKLKSDPRVTPIGRVLRKYSVDELPQLWNIFVGDMSLVGPRPPLPREVSEYEEHVNRRLYIKPGLTGLWQISGRSDLTWEESVRLDLYYVENWSLASDLAIMWRTLRVVLKPDGAY